MFTFLSLGVDKMIRYAPDKGHSYTDHNRYLHRGKLAHLVLFAPEVDQYIGLFLYCIVLYPSPIQKEANVLVYP